MTNSPSLKELERLTKLESSSDSFQADLRDIKITLIKIQDSISVSTRTNWGVIFSGIAVLVGIYAAAVRPIALDVERQQKEADKLAIAVLVQNEKINSIINDMVKISSQVTINSINIEKKAERSA